jgi:enoyl-CoA hydratase/carnithine racemase
MSSRSLPEHPEIRVEIEDDVALVRLDRPEHGNAWTFQMAEQYAATLSDLDADPSVRVIVLTGSGRAFCVGADMKVLDEIIEHGGYPPGAPPPEVHLRPLRVRKPLIAAVNGACAGVGLLMALTCDVRFGAEDAKFTTSFARVGLVAEYGMSWLLPRVIGLANALDLLLSGRVILGSEAERIGLLNVSVSRDQVLQKAMDYARDLAMNVSPTAVASIKTQVYGDLELSLDDAFRRTQAMTEAALASTELIEGVTSFRERRPPRFPPLSARPEATG